MNMIFCLPAVIAGQPILDVILVYGKQVVINQQMSLNYPNIYQIFKWPFSAAFILISIVITMLILGTYAYYIIGRKIDLSKENILCSAIWSVWTCCLFLPKMHERYGYMMEVLLSLYALAVGKRKWIVFAIVIDTIITCAYNNYLFAESLSLQTLAVINIIIYAIFSYSIVCNRKIDEV